MSAGQPTPGAAHASIDDEAEARHRLTLVHGGGRVGRASFYEIGVSRHDDHRAVLRNWVVSGGVLRNYCVDPFTNLRHDRTSTSGPWDASCCVPPRDPLQPRPLRSDSLEDVPAPRGPRCVDSSRRRVVESTNRTVRAGRGENGAQMGWWVRGGTQHEDAILYRSKCCRGCEIS
jgi:hypothetical protein